MGSVGLGNSSNVSGFQPPLMIIISPFNFWGNTMWQKFKYALLIYPQDGFIKLEQAML